MPGHASLPKTRDQIALHLFGTSQLRVFSRTVADYEQEVLIPANETVTRAVQEKLGLRESVTSQKEDARRRSVPARPTRFTWYHFADLRLLWKLAQREPAVIVEPPTYNTRPYRALDPGNVARTESLEARLRRTSFAVVDEIQEKVVAELGRAVVSETERAALEADVRAKTTQVMELIDELLGHLPDASFQVVSGIDSHGAELARGLCTVTVRNGHKRLSRPKARARTQPDSRRILIHFARFLLGDRWLDDVGTLADVLACVEAYEGKPHRVTSRRKDEWRSSVNAFAKAVRHSDQ